MGGKIRTQRKKVIIMGGQEKEVTEERPLIDIQIDKDLDVDISIRVGDFDDSGDDQ